MILCSNISLDDDAWVIVNRHLNKSLLTGVIYELDMMQSDKYYKVDYYDEASYGQFPKWFKGDYFDFLLNIKNKMESVEVYSLSLLERFVLMNALTDYYDDACDDEYSLELAIKVFEDRKKYEMHGSNMHIFPIADAKEREAVVNYIIDNEVPDYLDDFPDETVSEAVTYFMKLFEDATEYTETCFPDSDHVLLRNYTLEELKLISEELNLGIDL